MKSCLIGDVVWALECDCGRDDAQFFYCYGCKKMWCTECYVMQHRYRIHHVHDNAYKIVTDRTEHNR